MSPRRAKAVRGRTADDPATALREHLIDATAKLLTERQVTALTTRDIARAAGVSDGVLYNYFADKQELVLAAVMRRYATFLTRFDTGMPTAGTGTVEGNLTVLACAALDLIADTLPMAAGLLNEPALLHRFIEEIHQQPDGAPQRLHRPIAEYLLAEQRLGRLGEFEPDPAIALIMGPAVMLAFNRHVAGTSREELGRMLADIVRTAVRGLLPP